MGFTDGLTFEQIEAADFSELTLEERLTIAGELYHRAPITDSLSRRTWLAQKLGLPRKEVSRVLWRLYGIRWESPQPKRPPRKPRVTPSASS